MAPTGQIELRFSDRCVTFWFSAQSPRIQFIDLELTHKIAAQPKAAGTRIRKMMQDIKAAAQDVRKKILELRSADNP